MEIYGSTWSVLKNNYLYKNKRLSVIQIDWKITSILANDKARNVS